MKFFVQSLCVLFFCIKLFAYENEIEGFNDLRWQDPVNDKYVLHDSENKEGTKIDKYTIKDSKPIFLDIAFENLFYIFRNNKFYSVKLTKKFSIKSFNEIIEQLTKQYGKPDDFKCNYFAWYGEKSDIALIHVSMENQKEEDQIILGINKSDKPIENNTKKVKIKEALEIMKPGVDSMIKGIYESYFDILSNKKTSDKLADFAKNFYDSLLIKGFKKDDAIEIVKSTVPKMINDE